MISMIFKCDWMIIYRADTQFVKSEDETLRELEQKRAFLQCISDMSVSPAMLLENNELKQDEPSSSATAVVSELFMISQLFKLSFR